MRLGDKPLHLDPSLHYVSLSSGTNSCILHLRAFAASREKLPVADSPRSVPLCALSLKMHAACAHDLSRNQSVDQGGTRRPGGFFDGEIQSPPGTAGSTVWRHASPGRTWSDCMATAQRIGIAADPGGLFPGRGHSRSPALDGLRWVQGDRMNSVGCTPSRWRAARYCVLIISFTSVGLEILTRSVSGLVSSSASTVMVP